MWFDFSEYSDPGHTYKYDIDLGSENTESGIQWNIMLQYLPRFAEDSLRCSYTAGQSVFAAQY